MWNPYNLDLSSFKDSSGSGSSYSFDTYNPKYNDKPEEAYWVSDWESDYSVRPRGNSGSDMFAAGTSPRTKKTPTSNSSGRNHSSGNNGSNESNKRGSTTKLKPRQHIRNSKRISQQPSKDLDRELVPPPAKH